MKRVLSVVMVFFALAVAAFAQTSGTWAIVCDNRNGQMFTIDLSANPTKVYGPFLLNHLGTRGGMLLDVAVTPDNKYALFSNFGDRLIFKVDIQNPMNPVLLKTLVLPMFAEDIAIHPSGEYAIVTDGGFSPTIIFVNIANFTIIADFSLSQKESYAQSCDVSSDHMAVFADYSGSRIVYGQVNAARTDVLNLKKVSVYGDDGAGGPVNAVISPDGGTVAVAANTGKGVFFLKKSGQALSPGSGLIRIHGKPQSLAFSPDGKKLYAYCCIKGDPIFNSDLFVWFNITSDGNATLGGQVSLPTRLSSAYFGVDNLAVTRNGQYALVTFASDSSGEGLDKNIRLVNLSNYGYTQIKHDFYSAGIACFGGTSTAPLAPVAVQKKSTALGSALTWGVDLQNTREIKSFKIYRRVKDDMSAVFELVTEVPARILWYYDRSMGEDSSYQYLVTAIGTDGAESSGGDILE